MNASPATPPARAGHASAGEIDPAMALARATVAALLRIGVREAVVCAGARNAALVAVLAATPALRLWSFPEERSASFFALGRILSLDTPVAVVTTSGTAAAELLPAAVEALYQALPLVLVTADRPRACRGTGAPQAIDQTVLFCGHAAFCADVATPAELAAFDPAIAGWDRRRPVHFNICLDEPSAAALSQAGGVDAAATPAPMPASAVARGDTRLIDDFLDDAAAGPLVAVVAALPACERDGAAGFLRRLGCPVMAEATSGLRECPGLVAQIVHGGEAAIARLPVGRVLRIGAVPASRWWRDLENRPDVRVLSLTPSGFPGLARTSLVTGFPEWQAVRAVCAAGDGAIARSAAPEALEAALESALEAHPRGEPALVRALSCAVPRGALVFLGNSLPVREWNAFATTAPKSLRCFANRGANGIDGCVSTFLGLSAGEPESWAVIGDLTALYDLAALWITPALPERARRRIAVINNGGGRIFSRVAALRGLAPAPRRLMENPHGLDFRHWAEMFGWAHARAATADDIHAAAARPEPHLVLEIVPDPADTEAVWARLAHEPAPAAAGPASPET